MSTPTESSVLVGLQKNQSSDHAPSRRQLPRSRRLVFWGCGVLLLLAVASVSLLIWQARSPQLSFLLLKYGMRTHVTLALSAVVDDNQIVSTLSEQVLPSLLASAFDKPDTELNAADELKKQLLIKTFQSVLPTVLSSMRHTKDAPNVMSKSAAANDYVMKHVLPLALHIQPHTWTQWFEKIRSGQFRMEQCRYADSRAACEVVVEGPGDQSAILALLWEKSGWMWRLQGVEGFDRLLAAMRVLPERR